MEREINNNENSYLEHGHPEHNRRRRAEATRKDVNSRAKTWIAIGVAVLIVLLLVWLTIADLWGDTDVAAQLTGLATAHTPYILLI